ncbi:MAG: hypothetical protein RL095_3684 [Verrucomicrobiota bacterium]|jgi:hypothetical protein
MWYTLILVFGAAALVWDRIRSNHQKQGALRLMGVILVMIATAGFVYHGLCASLIDEKALKREIRVSERMQTALFEGALKMAKQKKLLKGKVLVIHSSEANVKDEEWVGVQNSFSDDVKQWRFASLSGPNINEKVEQYLEMISKVDLIIVLVGSPSGEALLDTKLEEEGIPLICYGGEAQNDWITYKERILIVAGMHFQMNSEKLEDLAKKDPSLDQIFSALGSTFSP